MWQIIKAEYVYAFNSINIKIIPYSILYLLLFYSSSIKSELFVFYLFAGGIILALSDDNRFYLFAKLPIANKNIAFIRLQMLVINFSFLLVIIIPIILIQENAIENLLKLFLAVGLFLLMRLFSFLLFDIISGFSLRKKRLYLTLLLILGTLIFGAYSYIITAFFRKPEVVEVMVVLSFLLVPILAYLSIKIFLVKEIITVKEQ